MLKKKEGEVQRGFKKVYTGNLIKECSDKIDRLDTRLFNILEAQSVSFGVISSTKQKLFSFPADKNPHVNLSHYKLVKQLSQ